MDINQIKRIYYTLKYLKYTQVYHQIKYRVIKPKRSYSNVSGSFANLKLMPHPEKSKSLACEKDLFRFKFLNLEVSFVDREVRWSFDKNGMLWTYNLNYFDYLQQPNMTKELGLELLGHFYKNNKKNPIILHSYPTSLRIINVSKFIVNKGVNEEWLYKEILADLQFLDSRLEYHLLGNHLLENAFALYIGGIITRQEIFHKRGVKLLKEQLNEQILKDGMHYERSPMYHLIILERLLDALNFSQAVNDGLENVLKPYAVNMVGCALNWEHLNQIPMMQDSTYDIAVSLGSLLEYAKSILKEMYPSKHNDFKESGYRKMRLGNLELIVNVGNIGPSYQPGHSHADELNFELFYRGEPVISDVGISTYEKNYRRYVERSTQSHNCVTLGGNSSDVWSGFRVGQRAKVDIVNEDDNSITAKHNGYKHAVIKREYRKDSLLGLTIVDSIIDKKESKGELGQGRLHFHPDCKLTKTAENTLCINNSMNITFKYDHTTTESFEVDIFKYSQGYNQLRTSTVVVYPVFKETLITFSEVY